MISAKIIMFVHLLASNFADVEIITDDIMKLSVVHYVTVY